MTDTTNLNSYGLKPLEAAIFWFMRAHELGHQHQSGSYAGVSADECAEFVGRDPTEVRRAWRGLERAGLITVKAANTKAAQLIRAS